MNLVVARFDRLVHDVAATKIFESNEQQLDRRLADLSMQVDEYIFHELQPVDVVYVSRGNTAIDIADIKVHDTETAYFPHGLRGSFYCSPEVFSNLGKMYKLDFRQLTFINTEVETEQLLVEKMLFVLIRMGYKVDVKE